MEDEKSAKDGYISLEAFFNSKYHLKVLRISSE